MFNVFLSFLQTICCIIIFITGVTWIADSLPVWKTSGRLFLKLLADALVTSSVFVQLFRSPDLYLCFLLLGVTVGFMTHREVSWWSWIWHGVSDDNYRGASNRRVRH